MISTEFSNGFDLTTTPGQESGFELSQCKDRCSIDPSCKGYSELTVNYTLPSPPYSTSFDSCFLFTTSNASSFCSHNLGNDWQITGNISFAVGPLDSNAECNNGTEENTDGVTSNYYDGCHIKIEDIQGTKIAHFRPNTNKHNENQIL